REMTRRSLLHVSPPAYLDQGKWERAFSWACSYHEGSALIVPEVVGAEHEAWRAFDPLVVDAERPDEPWVWDFLVERVTVDTAESVGATAYITGQPAVAERAWALGRGGPGAAALYLGALYN